MNAHNEQQGYTAADMADQAAAAFERGRDSVLAELHAAAPATYFPLTLRGLIAYGQVAADPSQGAVPNHMRYLIEQMVPHLKRLDEIESSTPAALGIDRCSLLDIVAWRNSYTGPEDKALGEVIRRIRTLIDASPNGALNEQFGSAEELDSPKSGSGVRVRECFEAWVQKRWGLSVEKWADSGKYKYHDTGHWWQAWQAALQAQAGDVEVQL